VAGSGWSSATWWGHNIGSASIMGQMRHLLRAYAVDRMHPADVLLRTARAQARLLPDTLATVVYALLDPATGELSYANAGHPPPVWATASGQAGYLDDASGVMLGVPVEPAFTVGHRTLDPGTSLMFYTDGLIEDRRRDISDGLSALAGVMGGSAPLSAERTCATVQAALLGDTPRADDVCLLAVRLTGLAGGSITGGWVTGWLPGPSRLPADGPAPRCRKGYIQANQPLESA
jgi:serine phosphatase RsbU (regulator of sigma subunit)